MKKIIYTLALLGLTTQIKAADLTVQENGPVGTYGSITSAITAAVDGDRIIIHPKIGQNAWVENITINKSLELVSSEDTVRYKIDGVVDVVGAVGRNVIFSSAELTTGRLNGLTASVWKTSVSVLNCVFNNQVNFENSYNVLISGCVFGNARLNVSNGKVIGNDISKAEITIRDGVNVTDSIYLIGNKIKELSLLTQSPVLIINNYLYNTETNYGSDKLIRFFNGASIPSKVILQNNTLVQVYGDDNRDSFISNAASTTTIGVNIVATNNVFVGYRHPSNSSTYNLPPEVLRYVSSGNVSSNHNYFYSTSSSQFKNNEPSDVNVSTPPISQVTGRLLSGSPVKDMANPSFEYYDFDLTRGDAGCYGGSYSLDNYFPITGSSRVFSVDMPFGLTTGGTLNIKAEGFDR